MIENNNQNISIEYLDEIDSTNEEAKRRVLKGINEDFALVASCQTAGKGRKGRSFYSPKNTGLYLTYTHLTDNKLEDNLRVTVASSVIVRRAIQKVLNIDCGIKWVNDLYYKNKKICGILCEAMLKDSFNIDHNAIIVGIGINLSTNDFPEDISNKAGALLYGSSEIIDNIRQNIAKEIVSGLKEYFKYNDLFQYMDEYRQSSIVIGKKVKLNDAGGEFAEGIVEGFTDSGEMILLDDNKGRIIVDSGEISLIIV